MRPLVFACLLAAVSVMGSPRMAGGQQTRPATRPAWVDEAPRPAAQWVLDAIGAAERLTDSFGGTAPSVAPDGREIHVFSWTAAPKDERAAKVDGAAVAGKVVAPKHAAALRKVVVHWVDADGKQITSATLDVGALDGFRSGIFSVRQLLELVEVTTAPSEVRRLEGTGDAVAGPRAARLRYELALHGALLAVMRQIVADAPLVEALSLEVRDAPQSATTESATQPTSEPATRPASQPATGPSRKQIQLGGLTFLVAAKGAGGGEGDVELSTKTEPTVKGAFAIRDALARHGVHVTPVSTVRGRLTVAALCLLKPGRPASRPTPEPEPEPEPEPDDDDDTPLPRID